MQKQYVGLLALGIILLIIIDVFSSQNYFYKGIVKVKNHDVVFIRPTDAHAVVKYATKSYLTRGDDYYCRQFKRPYFLHLYEQEIEVQIKECSQVVANLHLLEEARTTQNSEACFSGYHGFAFDPAVCQQAALGHDYSTVLKTYFLAKVNFDQNGLCDPKSSGCEEYTENVSRLVEYYAIEAEANRNNR